MRSKIFLEIHANVAIERSAGNPGGVFELGVNGSFEGTGGSDYIPGVLGDDRDALFIEGAASFVRGDASGVWGKAILSRGSGYFLWVSGLGMGGIATGETANALVGFRNAVDNEIYCGEFSVSLPQGGPDGAGPSIEPPTFTWRLI